jgi:membrane protein
LVAAGVSFYAFLSIFPAITALFSIYSMIADPSQIAHQMGSFKGAVPSSALQLIQKQLSSIAHGSGSSLSIGLAVSILLAIYSASKGVGALIASLNIAYGEEEGRGFIKLKSLTLLFTFAAVIFVVVMLGVIGLPSYLRHTGMPGWLNEAIRIVRWIIMLGLMTVALAVVYSFAPNRSRPQVQWVSPGAILATVFWLIASIGFSFYITHFGSYNKTYGSAAAIVILMMWFWISAFVILLGAELNAELESQTRKDSTGGEPASPGDREAVAADKVKELP